MAMVFHMHTTEGERRPVQDARRFAHYVGNVRYWFAVHDAPEYVGTLAVSHWDSGKRACLVTPTERIAAVGMDDKAIAKAAIDKIIAKHGAARVASVLQAAEE